MNEPQRGSRAFLPHLGLTLVYALWGLNMVSMKVGGKEWDSFVFNGLRFLLVAPLFWGYAYHQARRGKMSLRMERRDLLALLGLGILSAIGMEALLAFALQYTDTASGAVLGRGLLPAATVLLGCLLGQIRLTRRMLIGLPVAFLGVVLMVLGGSAGFHPAAGNLLGDLLLLLRSAIGAVYLTYMARLLANYPLPLTLAWEMTAGAVVLLPFTAAGLNGSLLASVPPIGWASLAYTVLVATVLGFALHNWSLARLGPYPASVYGYLHPLTSALAGALLLAERLGPLQYIGGLIVLAAMFAVQQDRRLSADRRSIGHRDCKQDSH